MCAVQQNNKIEFCYLAATVTATTIMLSELLFQYSEILYMNS